MNQLRVSRPCLTFQLGVSSRIAPWSQTSVRNNNLINSDFHYVHYGERHKLDNYLHESNHENKQVANCHFWHHMMKLPIKSAI